MNLRFLFTAGLALFLHLTVYSQNPGDVVINEIMYAPTGTPNSGEWFEIFNKSPVPVNLANWKWKDATATLRTITTQNVILNPNSFCVIAEDTAAVKSFYAGFSGIILQPTNGWSGLNNTGDQIILFTASNVVMDSINFTPSWGGSTGNRSMERISPLAPTNQQSNWGTSMALPGATPNLQNSISPRNNDLVLNIIFFSSNNPVVGTNLTIFANVKNRGLLPASNYSVSFYEDYNRDTIPSANELITTLSSTGSLNPGDSVDFNASDLLDSLGIRQYIARVNFPADEDTTNNKKAGVVNVVPAVTSDSLIFNEIMYAPSGTPNGAEWFELYNRGTSPVNLSGWKWRDSTGSQVTITTQNITINPGGYAVICQDSAAVKSFYPNNLGIYIQTQWLALNNTGDNLYLYNSSGSVADNVNFSSNWGGSSNNKSLERVSVNSPSNNQNNWGTSADVTGATPNKVNSLTPKPHDLALNKITFSEAFPSIGDTLGITAQVKNRGLNTAPSYTVSFYDDYNRDSLPSPNELKLTVNSTGALNTNDSASYTYSQVLDSAGLRQYISVVTYAQDNDTTNNKRIASIEVSGGSTAGTVIINEIMYDEPENECEWFELYNNSDSVVNLKNWKMQDNTSTQRIITAGDYFIQQHTYAVISRNRDIYNNHPQLDSNLVVIPPSWFELSLDDVVTVYKVNGAVSDRVDYLSSWGGDGVSLERIEINGISGDSSNWASSIDCERSTPARINSLKNAPHYNTGDLIINEIMAGPITEEAEYIELYNPTNRDINIANWLMFETGGQRIIADTCSAIIKPGMYAVIAESDTIFTRFPHLLTPDSTMKVFLAGSLGLNNDADLVKVTDIFRTKIDSVFYNDDWYNPNLPGSGRSLEKINPGLNGNDGKSWSSCTFPSGGSPGLKNSVYTTLQPNTAQVSVTPNPFSPDGDGWEDFAIINYTLSSTVSQVRCKIFDVKGRLIRTLLNNQASGSQGQIVFNGLDEEKRKLRLGIYVVFIEALNDQNGVVETIKTTLVVAAKL